MNLFARALGLPETRATVTTANVKAPRGAVASLQWNSPNQPIYGTNYKDQAALDLATTQSIYAYRSIQTLANAVSGCPFRAGDPVTKNIQLGAKLAELLGPAPGAPNAHMSSGQLWRYSIAQYQAIGKFCWVKGKDKKGKIVSLWPLQAQHIYPIPADTDKNGNPIGDSYFKGFQYGNPGQPGYVPMYTPDEVVFVYNMSWGNPLEPHSPLKAAASTLNIQIMLDMFDYALLKNGAVPAGMLITPPFATSEDREGFRRQFVAEFGGPASAGKTFFAEREFEPGEEEKEPSDSVKYVPMGTSPRDSQLSVLRDQKILDICVAFGVPLSLLGNSMLSKFNNMDSDRRNFWLERVAPLLQDLADHINIQLAPDLGPQIGWFDTTSIPELAPLPRFNTKDTVIDLESNGFITKDEWRADMGLAPIGYTPLSPTKDAVTSTVDDQLSTDNVVGDAAPTKAPPMQKALGGRSIEDILEPELLIAIRSRKKLKPAIDINDAIKTRKEHTFSVRHSGKDGHQNVPTGHLTKPLLESMLTKQLRLAFNEQRQSLDMRLGGRRAKQVTTPEKLYDQEFWATRMTEVLEPLSTPLSLSETELREWGQEIATNVFTVISGLFPSSPEILDINILRAGVNNVFELMPNHVLSVMSSVLNNAMSI